MRVSEKVLARRPLSLSQMRVPPLWIRQMAEGPATAGPEWPDFSPASRPAREPSHMVALSVPIGR